MLEKTLESPLDCREIKSVHPKGNQSWIFIGRSDAKAETATLWPPEVKKKRPWCWERLKVGEGDDRGWDGWIVSPTQWTWVWVNSGSWWWTERPGMLQSMGSQRVGHNWATEPNSLLKILFARHCSKHFDYISSFIPPNNYCVLKIKNFYAQRH